MVRQTQQKTVLENAMQLKKGFFTVDDLHRDVKTQGISLATVYRFLHQQAEQGELHPYVCNGKHVYSLDKKSHCHYICEHTGKTKHFELRDLGFLEGIVPGTIDSVQLEVRGTCLDCRGEY